MAVDSRRQAADWVEAALAEYEAHRAEVLAEGQGQLQTLALGATAVGILVAGAFNVWDDRLLAAVAFLGAIPLLCILILIQWAGRTFGMMQVGVYLEGVEEALRDAYGSVPPPVLTWERALAGASSTSPKWWKPQPGWNDFGAIAVFALIAAGSITLGAYRGYDGHEELVVILTAIQVMVLLLSTATVAWNVATVRQRARGMFKKSAGPAD